MASSDSTAADQPHDPQDWMAMIAACETLQELSELLEKRRRKKDRPEPLISTEWKESDLERWSDSVVACLSDTELAGLAGEYRSIAANPSVDAESRQLAERQARSLEARM